MIGPDPARTETAQRVANTMVRWAAVLALPAGVAIGAAAIGVFAGPGQDGVEQAQETTQIDRLTGTAAQDRRPAGAAGTPPADD